MFWCGGHRHCGYQVPFGPPLRPTLLARASSGLWSAELSAAGITPRGVNPALARRLADISVLGINVALVGRSRSGFGEAGG
jgi:hypothetical protein